MGTINYKSNQFPTLVIDSCCGWEDQCEEYDDYFIYEYIYPQIDDYINSFDFKTPVNVYLEGGYYEGVQVIVDADFIDYLYFDDDEERSEASIDLSEIEKLLKELVSEFGFRVCFPGWCTGYLKTEKESIDYIKKSMKELRQDVKTKIPLFEAYDGIVHM